MKFKILSSLVAIMASTSLFAYTDTTVNVDAASKFDTAMPWTLASAGDSFDIENTTSSEINVTIKVLTSSFVKGTFLGLSTTWVSDNGLCGVANLGPKHLVSCNIGPQGHLILSYTTDLTWDGKTQNPFQGLYTLSHKIIS